MELPFEEYTGNGTCLLSGEKRLVGGKESYICVNLGFEQWLEKYWCCNHSSSIFAVFSKLSLPQRNERL